MVQEGGCGQPGETGGSSHPLGIGPPPVPSQGLPVLVGYFAAATPPHPAEDQCLKIPCQLSHPWDLFLDILKEASLEMFSCPNAAESKHFSPGLLSALRGGLARL